MMKRMCALYAGVALMPMATAAWARELVKGSQCPECKGETVVVCPVCCGERAVAR